MQNGLLTDSGYLLQAKSPLDVRQKFDSVEEMKNYNENFLYDGAETTITLEGEIEGTKYNWFSNREIDETLGKWRKVTASVDFVTEEEMNALLIEIFGDLDETEEVALLDKDRYILIDSNGYSLLAGEQTIETTSYAVADNNGNKILDVNNYVLTTS